MLTDKEITLIKAIPEVAARKDIKSFIDDNFSWFHASDIVAATNMTYNQVGGLMTSLLEKSIIIEDRRGEFALNENIIEKYADQITFANDKHYRVLVVTRVAACGGDSHWFTTAKAEPWRCSDRLGAFNCALNILDEGAVQCEVVEFQGDNGGIAWRIKRSN